MEKLLNKITDTYFEEMIESIQGLVKINSVLDENSSSEKAPFGHKIDEALKFVLAKGQDLGLETKNLDGYAGHVEIGAGQEIVGILGHIDVVPEGKGWSVDPYGGQIKDGKLYGRGSLDDKGPVLACLYAMKAIEESGLPVKKRARLIVGTDEETGDRCIKHYLQNEEKPIYGFSPDANFPIIYAEKGILRCELVKELKENNLAGPVIKKVQGGTRVNVVPDYAEACLSGINADALRQKLQKSLDKNIKVESDSAGVLIKACGISAHAMQPDVGLNAIQLLISTLNCLNFMPSEAKRFIDLLAGKLKMEIDGTSLGIACEDDISGKLTLNTGVIDIDEKRAIVKFDIRYPVTQDVNMIINRFEEAAAAGEARFNVFQHKPPLHVDKNSLLIKKLQHVYKEMTGEEPTLISIGGGTYCRLVENTVSFGPVFPGQKELAHQSDEYIGLDDLRKMAKIYAQAIYELIK